MEDIIIFSCLTIFSLVLFCVSILSYWRYKKIKLLFISMVFLVFLIRSVVLSLSLFYDIFASFSSSNYIWILDLIILVILYLTSMKR